MAREKLTAHQTLRRTMEALPRSVFMTIMKQVVRCSPCRVDQMRLLGISPGKLQLPDIIVAALAHTHGRGSATLVLALPNSKQYWWQRTIHYSLPDGGCASPHRQQVWEVCSLVIVRDDPVAELLAFGGGMNWIEIWDRTAENNWFQDYPLYD